MGLILFSQLPGFTQEDSQARLFLEAVKIAQRVQPSCALSSGLLPYPTSGQGLPGGSTPFGCEAVQNEKTSRKAAHALHHTGLPGGGAYDRASVRGNASLQDQEASCEVIP